MNKRRSRTKNKKVFYQVVSGVCLLGTVILGTYYIATIPQRQQNEATAKQIEQKLEVMNKENKTKAEEVKKLKTEYQGLEGQSKELVQKAEELNNKIAEEVKKDEAFTNKLNTKKEEVKKHLLDVNNKLTSTYESNKENYPKLEVVQLENGLKHIRYKEITMDEAIQGLVNVGKNLPQDTNKAAEDTRLANPDKVNLYDFKLGQDGSWDNGFWLSDKLLTELSLKTPMGTTLSLYEFPNEGQTRKEVEKYPGYFESLTDVVKGFTYNFLVYGDPFAYIGWPKEIMKYEDQVYLSKRRVVSKGSYDYDEIMGTNFSGQNPKGYLNHITYENN